MQHKEKNTEHRMRLILKDGAAAAWPICLGYLPLGVVMGALAAQAGISAWMTGLMSLTMFSGMQIIAIAMMDSGASMTAIVLAIFVVNLRYALMSSALAVHFQGQSRLFLAGFSHGITDESFAVNLLRFQEGPWDRLRALAVNNFALAAWIFASIAGCLLGQFIPKGAFGMDYTLIAMFICLLVMQLKNRLLVVTALLSMGLAVLWRLFVPGDTYIIVGAVGGATLGFCLKRLGARLAKRLEARGR